MRWKPRPASCCRASAVPRGTRRWSGWKAVYRTPSSGSRRNSISTPSRSRNAALRDSCAGLDAISLVPSTSVDPRRKIGYLPLRRAAESDGMKPAVTLREESNEVPPTPVWHSVAAQCPLCGGRRRDYLFVVGQSRMTRCHECGLISKTDAAGNGADGDARSYLLDGVAERALREGLGGRVLQVVLGGEGGLASDGRLDGVTLTLPDDAQTLEAIEPLSFDAAFVNGAVEQVRDPVALLRRVRAALKPGGVLSVVVGSGDLARLPARAQASFGARAEDRRGKRPARAPRHCCRRPAEAEAVHRDAGVQRGWHFSRYVRSGGELDDGGHRPRGGHRREQLDRWLT